MCCNSTCVLHPSDPPPTPAPVGVLWASWSPSISSSAAAAVWVVAAWAERVELWVEPEVETVPFWVLVW